MSDTERRPGGSVANWSRQRRMRRGEDARQRILQAAFNLIAANGITGLRTRDVAAAAGVNIAAIHYYFASKENLMEAVLESIGDRFYRDFKQLEGTGVDRIRAHFRKTVAYLAAEPELHRVWLNFLVESFRTPAIQTVFRRLLGRWRSSYQAALEESYQEGLPLPVDPERYTPILMSITEGAVVLALACPDTFDPLRYFQDSEAALLDRC